MGKGGRKSQDEEEVLGQIFDFVFKQAKKPADKRKPVKLGGRTATGELGSALAAVLEKPGVFLTNDMMSTLNDALTIEFARIKADETGDNKAKFTTTSMVDFIKDPNKFLNKPKLDAQAARKAAFSSPSYWGKAFENLGTVAWAHKYNLDLDSKKAIQGIYKAEKIGTEAEAARALGTFATKNMGVQPSEMLYAASRSSDLVGREIFGREGWELMTEEKRKGFQNALQTNKLKEYLDHTYSGSNQKFVDMAKARYDKLGVDLGNKGKFDLFNVDTYHALEVRNIQGRRQDLELYLKRHPGLSPKERENVELGIEKLGQTEVLVRGMHQTPEKIGLYRVEIDKSIKQYRANLSAARQSGDKEKIKFYSEGLQQLREGKRTIVNASFWSSVGTVEGRINSFKDIYGGGNALMSVLNGNFFNPDLNQNLCPSRQEGIVTGWHYIKVHNKKTGKDDMKRVDESIGINVAQEHDNTFVNLWNEQLTALYYLTPKSMMKTLFVNGEGFIYAKYMREKMYATSIANSLAKSNGWDASMVRSQSAEFAEYLHNIDYEKLLKKDPALMSELVAKGLNEKQIQALGFSSRLASFFSFGQRQRDKINQWMNANVFGKLRRNLYNGLVKRITDKEALVMLGKWVEKGGFQTLAKALTANIINALGVASGVGAFLTPIISGISSDILYDSAKVLIQVAMLLVVGILGSAFFILSPSSVRNFDSQTYAYTNVTPGDVYENPNFKGTSPIVDEETGDMADFVAGSLPDGEKCLLGSGSFHCSQGPYGDYSHQNVAAMDVTGVEYFYAPAFCGNDNCVVTYSGSAYCTNGYAGGEIIFTALYNGNLYQFTLIHVSTTFGPGSKLSAGERVARVMSETETTGACSSGKHIHIQAKMNGAIVDPQKVLENSVSAGGFGCNISVCDE